MNLQIMRLASSRLLCAGENRERIAYLRNMLRNVLSFELSSGALSEAYAVSIDAAAASPGVSFPVAVFASLVEDLDIVSTAHEVINREP